jgi:hypothetical protein
MWKSRLSIFFTGCNGCIAAKLYEWIISPPRNVPFVIAMIVSAITAAFSQSILEFLFFEAPLSFKVTRQLIDPLSRVEGYWLEQICQGEECHYSYARIEYAGKGKYKYYGLSYETSSSMSEISHIKDSQLRANFNSGGDEVHLVGDSSTARMYYSFRAKLYQPKENQSHDVTGYGAIDFYSDGTQEFNRGEGYFIDNSSEITEMELILTRITEKDIREFVPDPSNSKYLSNEEIKIVVLKKINQLYDKRSKAINLL